MAVVQESEGMPKFGVVTSSPLQENKRFNNPCCYFSHPETQVSYEPSSTVPNLSMSLNEILRRYTTGEPIPPEMMSAPHYNDGVLSPLSKKGVDLADYSAIRKQNAERINDLTQQVKRSDNVVSKSEPKSGSVESTPEKSADQ